MKNMSLGIKSTILTAIIVLITSGGLIYFSYDASHKQLEESIGMRLQSIASTAALMLNGKLGDYHRKLKIDGKDQKSLQNQKNSKEFKAFQEVLRKIKKTNQLKEAIYTFRLSEGTLKFSAMTQEKTFIGVSYKPKDFRAKDSVLKVYQDKIASHTRIYRSPNGVWISGHAPFFTSAGKIAGVLAIDIRFETFQKQLEAKAKRLLFVSLGILLFGLFLSILFSRQLIKKLKYLQTSAEAISLGEMDKVIQINSQDELGQLAQSLERMRESLKVAMDMLNEDEDEDDF